MEQPVIMQLYYYCGFCLVLALLVHVLLRAMSSQKQPGRPRLPPGPWQLPIIGSLHHLLHGLPHHTMRDLSLRHGPVMLIRVCERMAVVVSSAEAAREMFTDHGTAFEQRPSSPSIDEACSGEHRSSIIFGPYGERWRLLRRILMTELLSVRRVQSFRRVREEEAARLVSSLASASAGGRLVNVGGLLAEFITDTSVRAIFGNRLPAADRAAYLEFRKRGTDLSSVFDLRDLFPTSRLVRMLPRNRKAQQHGQELSRLMDNILRYHQERSAAAENGGGEKDQDEDMMDVLLRVQHDSATPVSLSPGVIKAIATEVFDAALDTSVTTLQWAMAELVANPRVMEKAHLETRRVLAGKERVQEASLGELRYLKAVIKETLRLHPPGALVARLCLEHGHKVQGYDVPYGTMIVANVWAISRDPKYWKDPISFVPERFEKGDECASDFFGVSSDFKFTPFGAGRRICPGINFAEANIEIALASLLYHFDWEPPSGEGIDMAEAFGVSVRRKAELLLQPIPRNPLVYE